MSYFPVGRYTTRVPKVIIAFSVIEGETGESDCWKRRRVE